MRRLLPLLLALLPAAPASAQMTTLSPEEIGEIFCMAHLGNDMDAIRGLLSPVLASAIDYAEARNDVIQRAAPDEKPPLGDGIPWQAVADYASICTVGPVKSSATATGVQIQYGFPDYPDDGFTDTLVLVPIPGPFGGPDVLRIDDIAHEGGSSLRQLLTSAFEP